MVRFFGIGTKASTKRRLTQSARTSQGMRENHPMYQYALNEFAQTVAAGSSNDDGRHRPPQDPPQDFPPTAVISNYNNENNNEGGEGGGYQAPALSAPEPPPPPSATPRIRDTGAPYLQLNASGSCTAVQPQTQPQQSTLSQLPQSTIPQQQAQYPQVAPSLSSSSSSRFTAPQNPIRTTSSQSATPLPMSSSSISATSHSLMSLHAEPALSRDWSVHSDNFSQVESSPRNYQKSPFEEGIVSNILYQESYGDAYTGAPLRYVYPSGYQSMRPRSGPWRLSILICLCFTWLSVFVVGHCSDQVSEAAAEYNEVNDIDDDTIIIEIRWCGSRPLYLMWLASMLITGLSAAYCGVIGYIKCRDFAVANSRAQPFLMEPQTSDYYYLSENTATTGRRAGSTASVASSLLYAQPQAPAMASTIYQADGTPQFWGSEIYRPTQAAVAVTSR